MIEEPRTGLMVREAPVDPVDPSCSTGPVWVTQCFKPAPGLFIQHADLYLLVLPFMFWILISETNRSCLTAVFNVIDYFPAAVELNS